MAGNEKADELGNNPTATCLLSDLTILPEASSKSEDGKRMEGVMGLHPAERNPVLCTLPPETRQNLHVKQPCTTVTQLRTGHGYFSSYLYKLPTNNTMTNRCNYRGNPPQTPARLIVPSTPEGTTTDEEAYTENLATTPTALAVQKHGSRYPRKLPYRH